MKFASALFFCLVSIITFGQSKAFVDSLKQQKNVQILTLKSSYTGWVSFHKVDGKYVESGKPWDLYVIWKQGKKSYIKHYNKQGSTQVLEIKKWENNPFELVNSSVEKLNKTRIKYPLQFNPSDSLWVEQKIDHYTNYEFQFLSTEIKQLSIRDYALKSEHYLQTHTKTEQDQLNAYRYKHNNQTELAQLLNILLDAIKENNKKLNSSFQNGKS